MGLKEITPPGPFGESSGEQVEENDTASACDVKAHSHGGRMEAREFKHRCRWTPRAPFFEQARVREVRKRGEPPNREHERTFSAGVTTPVRSEIPRTRTPFLDNSCAGARDQPRSAISAISAIYLSLPILRCRAVDMLSSCRTSSPAYTAYPLCRGEP